MEKQNEQRKLTKVEIENAKITEIVLMPFTYACMLADVEEQVTRTSAINKFCETPLVSNLPVSIRANVFSVVHIVEESNSNAHEALENYIKSIEEVLSDESILNKVPLQALKETKDLVAEYRQNFKSNA